MVDVGKLANVSAQTVSRYFTGTGYVGAETRERIAAAIDQLGYRPNGLARSMRSQRTNTVGVLSLGALNYGSAEVLTGLSLAARDVEFTLTITHLDLDLSAEDWDVEATRALTHFLEVQVDGIVISTPVEGADELIEQLGVDVPVITVSERPRHIESSSSTHSFAAAYEATSHLISLGHSEILHIAGPRTRNEAQERRIGYEAAMQQHGLTPAVLSDAVDWTARSGFRAGESAKISTFTAAFAANDEIALGFMSAMAERGMNAPSDYSIVGVDDMPSSAFFRPSLTTMRLDFRAVGASTFRMLHEEITTGRRPTHLVIEPELIVRSSTARRDSALSGREGDR